jgi:hypothetical protein
MAMGAKVTSSTLLVLVSELQEAMAPVALLEAAATQAPLP